MASGGERQKDCQQCEDAKKRRRRERTLALLRLRMNSLGSLISSTQMVVRTTAVPNGVLSRCRDKQCFRQPLKLRNPTCWKRAERTLPTIP